MGLGETAPSPRADLGGSSNYSNQNFEGRSGEGFHVNSNWTCVSRSAETGMLRIRRLCLGARKGTDLDSCRGACHSCTGTCDLCNGSGDVRYRTIRDVCRSTRNLHSSTDLSVSSKRFYDRLPAGISTRHQHQLRTYLLRSNSSKASVLK